MQRSTRRIAVAVLGAVVAVAALAGFWLTRVRFSSPAWDPALYAGWKATIVCSAVFVAGRPLEQVLVDELGGQPPDTARVAEAEVDPATRSVAVPYAPGQPPRLAVFREGMGCTNLPPGWTLTDAARLPRVATPPPPGEQARMPWPDGDLLPASLPAGLDPLALERAVEAAFDGETYGEDTKTIGVAVVWRGALVAERYRPGFDAHTTYRSWSAAKTITNALVGILVGEGRLDPQAPAPIPEWGAGDPRAAITLDQLLHMSSGLEREGAEAYPAYFGGEDTIEVITRARLEAEPGTRWHYANRDTLLLVRAMRRAISDDGRYWRFPRRELLDRIGMRHTVPETDAFGNFVLSSQVQTTARDLARFGLLYLQDGVWQGERILPEGWVAYSVRPAPARSRGVMALLRYGPPGLLGFGAQVWLYGPFPFFPDEAGDAYGALGHRGQCVTVVPSHELVVVRTGLDPEQDVYWRQDRFVASVLEALPGSPASD
jgi:CubicO group peptidase (beta-lactamase class C family)